MIDKLEAAQRLIQVVCGEPYGDGMTVTDVGVGYAEPGYHDDETVWVLGDWNDKSHFEELPGGGGKWITDNTAPSRLFAALERIGVQGEWSDEWQRCDHCQRIFRTSGDSYMWKPFYVDFYDDGYYDYSLCGECVRDPDFIEEALEGFVNHPTKVITFLDADELESFGWVRYNETPYESGFHPGQNDDARQIFKEIREQYPDRQVVFFLDEASQFYIRFSAFTNNTESEEEDGDDD